MLPCYNNACSVKQFAPEENHDGACTFHPGAPVFHEGYKFWSCCKTKKTIDFSEFLGMPGCASGKHNGVKPEKSAAARPADVKAPTEEMAVGKPCALEEEDEQESSEPLLITAKHTESAKIQYQRFVEGMEAKKQELIARLQESPNAVLEGSHCDQKGCHAKYTKESDATSCVYHPGVATFHEGCKFWSCCERRTTDFNAFLDQKGCTEGSHAWVNPLDSATEISTECRHDYFQGADDLTMNIYAKNVNYSNSFIQVTPHTLRVHLSFDYNKVYDREFRLFGAIKAKETVCTVFGTKLEIRIVKKVSGAWENLVQ